MKSRRIGILLSLLAGMSQLVFLTPAGAQAQPAPATSAATTKVSPVAPRKQQIQAIVDEAYAKFKVL